MIPHLAHSCEPACMRSPDWKSSIVSNSRKICMCTARNYRLWFRRQRQPVSALHIDFRRSGLGSHSRSVDARTNSNSGIRSKTETAPCRTTSLRRGRSGVASHPQRKFLHRCNSTGFRALAPILELVHELLLARRGTAPHSGEFHSYHTHRGEHVFFDE